jgi:hypothetical protein
MKDASKRARPANSKSKPWASLSSSATSQARRQAAAILEVLAGVLRPAEAARALEVSLPRYYQLERRALVALLAACEPVPRGPRISPSRQLAVLERENQRLRRECDRQQALVRAAERTLGLALPGIVKPSAKAKDQLQGSDGSPRRRLRRPTVRALKAARTLRAETAGVTSEGAVDAAAIATAAGDG